ncbi:MULTISPECIES: sensor histidine kinase [Pseudomonas]|jgi:signal transduction histidine kinase|uniref:histidine kinase n=1 Tax=Pseudomonas fluorescens TaxID=294 RepID=A0A4Y9TGZ3_PSEFL|nr:MULTISPECIES: sensor histidine kinase [Pseudomonas]CRM91356.1 Bacteriophytochrome [Pseudomonas sp. 22 E 5]MCX9153017.1 sensor histidine kinase [Pseudomonas sp. TB1-B1]TFW42660.1 sensor histidine kinase [Pseudomonas fluorescens]CRM43582.1 Bacteriophytochrome [Pseudomonas sp. 31 E 5]CRM61325.1 Bacteriophytochrome [Pseudomonas sp. 31 E 6]
MRLSDFILSNLEPILQDWEDFASTIQTPGAALDQDGLRDHAAQMLHAIVQDLRTTQTVQEQLDKAQGLAPQGDAETPAETHAVTRLMAGFSIDQMVSEYRALRTSVLRQWLKRVKGGTALDVDDMNRFHEAIDQALAESIASYSRAVEASRNVFLGILGHDLRTPLGAILLGADTLRRSQLGGERDSRVATQIYTSVQRASQIVGDLLDLTRCQMGPGIPVRRTQVDLVPICERIVAEIQAFDPHAQLRFESAPSAAGLFDGARMEQVFSNIISNAVHHGDLHSPIAVALTVTPDHCVFSVHNQGPPIPNDVLPFIFNPMGRFSQRSVIEHGPTEGLGLGLFIASEIVASHQGLIEVESDSRHGTVFRVTVPLNGAGAA